MGAAMTWPGYPVMDAQTWLPCGCGGMQMNPHIQGQQIDNVVAWDASTGIATVNLLKPDGGHFIVHGTNGLELVTAHVGGVEMACAHGPVRLAEDTESVRAEAAHQPPPTREQVESAVDAFEGALDAFDAAWREYELGTSDHRGADVDAANERLAAARTALVAMATRGTG